MRVGEAGARAVAEYEDPPRRVQRFLVVGVLALAGLLTLRFFVADDGLPALRAKERELEKEIAAQKKLERRRRREEGMKKVGEWSAE